MIQDKTKKAADPDLSPLRQNQIKLHMLQTEKLELKNAATRQQLVTIDEAVTVYREEAEIIRKHLHTVPDMVVRTLESLTPVEQTQASIMQAIIADCINSALRATNAEGTDRA
ncbi:hypothetical protein ACNJYA_09765 [Bradyrhizobium sp. DASA03068]|uniref:hypothetical protein n=1 Tax=Bradyrhizobium sp. BLXBL-01 TaxID=3395915 RepID=UPI003F7162D4